MRQRKFGSGLKMGAGYDGSRVSYWDLQQLYPRIAPPTIVRVLDEARFVNESVK